VKALTLIMTLLLSACGMTGDLYLPEEGHKNDTVDSAENNNEKS